MTCIWTEFFKNFSIGILYSFIISKLTRGWERLPITDLLPPMNLQPFKQNGNVCFIGKMFLMKILKLLQSWNINWNIVLRNWFNFQLLSSNGRGILWLIVLVFFYKKTCFRIFINKIVYICKWKCPHNVSFYWIPHLQYAKECRIKKKSCLFALYQKKENSCKLSKIIKIVGNF